MTQTRDGLGAFIVDREDSRCWWYRYDPQTGWQSGQSYPLPSGIEQIVAGPFEQVWLRIDDQIHATTWDGSRWSYPQQVTFTANSADSAKDVQTALDDPDELTVVGTGQVDKHTWLVMRTKKDLLLQIFHDQHVVKAYVFSDKAGKAEEAIWLGDDCILIQDKFAKQLRLLSTTDEQQLPADRNRKLAQYRLLAVDRLPVRLTDGVVQLLNQNFSRQIS